MSKKIQEKTNAKKISKHVEAKPLMTLEEAREVLKRHVAVDTEEGAERVMFAADKELGEALNNGNDVFNTPVGDEDRGYYPNEYSWHMALRNAARRISDAVELVIASETNVDLSGF